MKNKILFLLGITLVFLSSCEKSDDFTPVNSNTAKNSNEKSLEHVKTLFSNTIEEVNDNFRNEKTLSNSNKSLAHSEKVLQYKSILSGIYQQYEYLSNSEEVKNSVVELFGNQANLIDAKLAFLIGSQLNKSNQDILTSHSLWRGLEDSNGDNSKYSAVTALIIELYSNAKGLNDDPNYLYTLAQDFSELVKITLLLNVDERNILVNMFAFDMADASLAIDNDGVHPAARLDIDPCQKAALHLIGRTIFGGLFGGPAGAAIGYASGVLDVILEC